MKINFNSFCLGLGGGNRTVLELADGLTERGHNVTITHLGVPSYYRWYGKPKCEVRNLNLNVLLRFFNKYYLKSKGMAYDKEALLRNYIVDCDVNVATAYDTVYPTFFSRKGCPVYLVQDFEPTFYLHDDGLFTKASYTYELPMQKLCVSRWLAKKVKGEYLGNGVNLTKFRPLNLKRVYDVMVIKRHIPWKGKYDEIVSKLERNQLRVKVVYDVSEQALVRYYNQAKIFLYLAEKTEGFGLCNLEAMASETPVITTGCTEYCVNNKNALVLSKETDLFQQIINYWRKLNVPSFRREIVDAGLETAREHDFNKVVNRFIELVEN